MDHRKDTLSQVEESDREIHSLHIYLFILCAEVLPHMMNRAMADRSLLCVKISLQAPLVNHLLFADDSLFFSLANARACKKLKQSWEIMKAPQVEQSIL